MIIHLHDYTTVDTNSKISQGWAQLPWQLSESPESFRLFSASLAVAAVTPLLTAEVTSISDWMVSWLRPDWSPFSIR
jgi:hypothetical protein